MAEDQSRLGKTWFDKLLEERGIKLKKIDPPKGFVRVLFNPEPSWWHEKEDK